MDRRALLARGAALAAAGVLGGTVAGSLGGWLGAAEAGGVTNGSGRNGVSTAKPRRGGSVVYGTDAEEQGFNPVTDSWDEVGYMYGRTVFDPLLAVTTKGTLVPYLAQSVTPNADYTTWTVTLRPNLTFHDGTPCDGQALETFFEKQFTSLLIGQAVSASVKDARQVSDLAIAIDMKDPWVTFPYYLAASQVGYVAAPSMLNAPGGGSTKPIGTGPFVFQDWNPNDHFTATRNRHYWRKGLPYLDQITFKPIIDPVARSEALQAGTIDIMITNTPQTIVLYRGKSQWSYVDDSGKIVGEPNMNLILLNTAAPPFNDQNARMAMAHAIDTKAFNRIIDLGLGGPSTGPFVKGTPYYAPTGYPKYDRSTAARLVRAYHRQHGSVPSFTLTATTSPEIERAATYLQQQLENVGMKVKVATVEQNELIDNALGGKFQANMWRQFGTVIPDLNYTFWSTETVAKTGFSLNMARNADPRIQAALETGRTTTSAATRAQAYQEIGKYFAEDLPYLWLDRSVWAVVASPSVQNFNNPVAPSGAKLLGFESGSTWPTPIWVKS